MAFGFPPCEAGDQHPVRPPSTRAWQPVVAVVVGPGSLPPARAGHGPPGARACAVARRRRPLQRAGVMDPMAHPTLRNPARLHALHHPFPCTTRDGPPLRAPLRADWSRRMRANCRRVAPCLATAEARAPSRAVSGTAGGRTPSPPGYRCRLCYETDHLTPAVLAEHLVRLTGCFSKLLRCFEGLGHINHS